MILVDTSIIIDFVRGKDAKVTTLLPTLGAAVCGIVRAELLCGARDAKHRASLETLLAAFNHLSIPDSIWDAVGDHLAALRSGGLTIPFSDVVIATLAIEFDHEVWSSDPHFRAMQGRLPRLKLYQPPP